MRAKNEPISIVSWDTDLKQLHAAETSVNGVAFTADDEMFASMAENMGISFKKLGKDLQDELLRAVKDINVAPIFRFWFFRHDAEGKGGQKLFYGGEYENHPAVIPFYNALLNCWRASEGGLSVSVPGFAGSGFCGDFEKKSENSEEFKWVIRDDGGRTCHFDVMNSGATPLGDILGYWSPKLLKLVNGKNTSAEAETGEKKKPAEAEEELFLRAPKLKSLDDKGKNELLKAAQDYVKLTHTVGNFVPIPRAVVTMAFVEERWWESLNTFKGISYCRDYQDKFLWLLGANADDSGFYEAQWEMPLPRTSANCEMRRTRGCIRDFSDYLSYAKLEMYCMDNEPVEAFIKRCEKSDKMKGKKGAREILDAYEEIIVQAVGRRCEVHDLHSEGAERGLSWTDVVKRRDYSPQEMKWFFENATLRIKARGLLLMAIRELYAPKREESEASER